MGCTTSKNQIRSVIPINPVDCVICNNNKNFSIKLPCNHSFCVDCIDTWLSTKRLNKNNNNLYKYPPSCPLCRYNLSNYVIRNSMLVEYKRKNIYRI